MSLFGDHLHIHIHMAAASDAKIDHLIKITENMAKTTDELKAAVAEQNGIISNIAGDMDRIADKLENDPTEAELTAIVTEIRTNNEALRTISNRNLVAETETPPTDTTPEA